MPNSNRLIPNPESTLLKQAVVGGTGLGGPNACNPPPGMAAVVLYVPIPAVAGMSQLEIQKDLGLPWSLDGGGVWLDELLTKYRYAR